MNNLSRLLQEIKEDPVMYLGKPSITCLHSFLNGYLDARMTLGLDGEGSGIEGFQDWMQQLAKTQVSQSWAGILIFRCGSERSAFYGFFDRWKTFLNLDDSLKKKSRTGEHISSILNDLSLRTYDPYDDILKGIKKRPSMYLGTNSITNLDMLLRGCSLARREVGAAPTNSEREFAGFHSWLQQKYGIKSNQSWAKIILFYSIDEQEALWRFFELYEEYLTRDKSAEVDSSSGSSAGVSPPQANQI